MEPSLAKAISQGTKHERTVGFKTFKTYLFQICFCVFRRTRDQETSHMCQQLVTKGLHDHTGKMGRVGREARQVLAHTVKNLLFSFFFWLEMQRDKEAA